MARIIRPVFFRFARTTESLSKTSMYALTPREIAVLDAVRQGRPNKIIAQELGISESTIKVHVHRIMKKLKVRNRTQAAMYARN